MKVILWNKAANPGEGDIIRDPRDGAGYRVRRVEDIEHLPDVVRLHVYKIFTTNA